MTAHSVIEGMPGQLDLFEKPLLQAGILGANYYQYKPTTSIADSTQLEFRIPGTGDFYIDLSKTLFSIQVKIVKEDNTSFEDTEAITPINGLFDSLFSDIKTEFNQKPVSDSKNLYHYKCYFENLVNFNETAKKTHLSAKLWVQDEPGKHDDGANKALLKRFEMTKGSKLVDMAGKIHVDVLNTDKFLLNEVGMRFLFVKNKSEIILQKNADVAGGKVKILDASLWIRKVKISPSLLIAHSNTLNKFAAQYPYKRVEMLNHTIPQGTQQYTLENLFLGHLPSRIILAMVSHKAFSGDYALSPFNFQHFGLNYLSVFRNGEQINSRAFTPKFGTENASYAMPYLQSFLNSGIPLSDDGYCVDLHDWQKGYVLFPFDFTPDYSSNEQHWCLQEQGNIRIELAFDKALTEPITIIIYSEFRSLLQIDKNRECILE